MHFIYNILCISFQRDTVAEWLRRSTRNRLGLSRVGSSPASVDQFLHLLPVDWWMTFVGCM